MKAPNDENARDAAELNTLRENNARLAGQLAEVVAAHEALLRSISLSAPLRSFYPTIPPWLSTLLRRIARLAWWTVTLNAPRRLAERRAALVAAAQPLAPPAGAEPTPLVPEEALGFDRSWYLAAYPDVAEAGIDAYEAL